jgi:DNA-binding MarR family transcriptional regulator
LRIVAALHRNRELSFMQLREALDLTPGNLSSHAARLIDAGYVASRHALAGVTFELRYSLTDEGASAFTAYLAALQALVASAQRDPRSPEDRGRSDPIVGAGRKGRTDSEPSASRG